MSAIHLDCACDLCSGERQAKKALERARAMADNIKGQLREAERDYVLTVAIHFEKSDTCHCERCRPALVRLLEVITQAQVQRFIESHPTTFGAKATVYCNETVPF